MKEGKFPTLSPLAVMFFGPSWCGRAYLQLEEEFGETKESIAKSKPVGPFHYPLEIFIPKDLDGFLAAEKKFIDDSIGFGERLDFNPSPCLTRASCKGSRGRGCQGRRSLTAR